MNNFSQTATQLLKAYKALLKKHLSPEESEQKLSELQLNKRLPRREANLYGLVSKILEKAFECEEDRPAQVRYSGVNQFLQHMKTVLVYYRLENNKVIHAPQSAAKAMITAIQLMSLPKNKLTHEIFKKLESCSVILAHYGLEEQRQIFINSLNKYMEKNTNFFQPLLNNYQKMCIKS